MAYERAKKSKKKMEPVPVADKYMIHVRDVVDTSSSNRGTWVNKQTKYNKLRMRIKKAKTFPFIGCSNIRMPTAEIKLRKLKAALYNVVFGIRPVVTVVPPPGGRYETAMKIEKFLDHLIWDVMEYPIKKGIITIDQELEQGFRRLRRGQRSQRLVGCEPDLLVLVCRQLHELRHGDAPVAVRRN